MAVVMSKELVEQIASGYKKEGKLSTALEQLQRNEIVVPYWQAYDALKRAGVIKSRPRKGRKEMDTETEGKILKLDNKKTIGQIAKSTGFSKDMVGKILTQHSGDEMARMIRNKKKGDIDAFKWSEWIRVVD
ncbi:MAG TPA: hypothetical protein VMV00_03325 [Candidatus Baltobacteraceae bacterium]|nr:hypothetical protein [Candidatus Baltobacteraceae bacterium]